MNKKLNKFVMILAAISLAASGCLVSPEIIVGGPEVAATQIVGAAIDQVYEGEPNIAALLPDSLCPAPIVFWGADEEVVFICSNATAEKLADSQAFEADLAVVGVAALTPVPGDEVLAVVVTTAKRAVIIFGGYVAADYASRGLVALSRRHTDKNHNPNLEGSTARANISAILAIWSALLAQGPENGPKCGAIKDGTGAIQTLVVWIYEAFRPSGGYVAVYRPGNVNTPWLTSYDRSYEWFQKGPRQDKLPAGFVWDANVPCPDSLPGLQAATS